MPPDGWKLLDAGVQAPFLTCVCVCVWQGGGVYVYSGTLAMDSCNINNNQATGTVRARLLLETLFQRPRWIEVASLDAFSWS